MTQEERYRYARALLLAAHHIEEAGTSPGTVYIKDAGLARRLALGMFRSWHQVVNVLMREANRVCPGLRRTP